MQRRKYRQHHWHDWLLALCSWHDCSTDWLIQLLTVFSWHILSNFRSFLLQQLPLQSKAEMAKDGDLTILHRVVDEALQAILKMKKVESGNATAQMHRKTTESE